MRYAIVVVDYYSKWPVVKLVLDVFTHCVVTFLRSSFATEGLLSEIVTDNGPQFISTEFARYLKEQGVVHCRTAVYNPQCNDLVERFNCTLGNMLKTARLEGKTGPELDLYTQELLGIYRSTRHPVTGQSPSELLHGREMRRRLHVTDVPVRTTAQCDKAVRARVKYCQSKMKEQYDRRHGARAPALAAGDAVRIRVPGRVLKGHWQYSAPARVTARVGRSSVRLEGGVVWSGRRVAPSRIPVPMRAGQRQPPQQRDIGQAMPAARKNPDRRRAAPARLKDFVTN